MNKRSAAGLPNDFTAPRLLYSSHAKILIVHGRTEIQGLSVGRVFSRRPDDDKYTEVAFQGPDISLDSPTLDTASPCLFAIASRLRAVSGGCVGDFLGVVACNLLDGMVNAIAIADDVKAIVHLVGVEAGLLHCILSRRKPPTQERWSPYVLAAVEVQSGSVIESTNLATPFY
jgi:hypothetical protein